MTDAFTMDKMLEAMRKLEAAKPPGGFMRNVTLGQIVADAIKPATPRPELNVWGLPVKVSAAFPFQQTCSACGGTGYGETSTLCPRCNGAGEIRVEGVCENDKGHVILTSKLPRKAFVKWPETVGVPLRALEAL